MKLTRHNGSAGKNGVYNPKHNDRNFNVKNSDHIDPGRVRQNVYWDCYQGFYRPQTETEEQSMGARFELVEKAFYLDRYYDFCEAQNERNRKTGHIERNRDTDDLLKNKKTAPEESIIQIGTMDEHVDPEMLLTITVEFFSEFQRRFGEHVHILDWALHLDEATPHIHERHVFDCENRYGEIAPQQEKALELLGIPLPYPDKPPGRNNNRKITFAAICRTLLFDIAQQHGLHLDREPEYGGREYLEKQDYILMRQKQKLAEQSKDILINKMTLLEQSDELEMQDEKIADRDKLIAEKDEKIEDLTLKLNDVEKLMDEVAEAAYEKAVEAVTAEVIIQTQNQEIAEMGNYRKWLESPERKLSKKERETALSWVDRIGDFLKKSSHKVALAVKKKLLGPEVRKQKTTEITREAWPSILQLLKRPLPTQDENRELVRTRKESYDMDR